MLFPTDARRYFEFTDAALTSRLETSLPRTFNACRRVGVVSFVSGYLTDVEHRRSAMGSAALKCRVIKLRRSHRNARTATMSRSSSRSGKGSKSITARSAMACGWTAANLTGSSMYRATKAPRPNGTTAARRWASRARYTPLNPVQPFLAAEDQSSAICLISNPRRLAWWSP